jgi:hypothetical protein
VKHLNGQTVKWPKLLQLDNVLHTWFTKHHSKAKPVTGHMIIEKVKPFYGEMKVTDKHILRMLVAKFRFSLTI